MLKSITNIFEKKKWMYQPKEGEQFFFMHIPKTGGTTFRHMLYNHFPDGTYYPSTQDLWKNNGSYLDPKQIIKSSKKINTSIMIGHYNIDFVSRYSPNRKVLTFIKNPRERVLSHVKHLKNYRLEFKHKSYDEIIQDEIEKLSVMQCNFLGINSSDTKSIISQKLYKVDYLFISEYFDTSIELCDKLLGWKLKKIKRKNEIKVDINNLISRKSELLIEEKTMKEFLVYNLALQKFKNCCNENKLNIRIKEFI